MSQSWYVGLDFLRGCGSKRIRTKRFHSRRLVAIQPKTGLRKVPSLHAGSRESSPQRGVARGGAGATDAARPPEDITSSRIRSA